MALDTDRIEKIGDLSENYFRLICIKFRMVSTSTSKDKYEWDAFVEIPLTRLPLVNIDEQPSTAKALVQIKATDCLGKMQVPVKVSNWEKLATTALPSFVFVVDYNGKDDPTRTFLCHFDNKRVGTTLKWVRELEADGKSEGLHKAVRQFSIREDEELTAGSSNLKEMMLSCIGSNLNEYIQNKIDILRNIGYDKGRYVFRVQGTMELAELADAAIGLGALKVDNATLSSVRFGIDIVRQQFGAGRLTIEHISTKACEIRATSHRLRKSAVVPGQIIFPPLGLLPAEHVKARVRSGSILEIILDKEDVKVAFSIDPTKDYTLDEAFQVLEFVFVCQDKRIKN